MKLRKDSKAEMIKNVPLFALCSKRQLAEVVSIADEIDLPAGKVLIREGERGREFFVLVDGTVDVDQGGRRLRTMSGGEFFGEIALISNVPRTATVTAASPVHALVIRDTDFRTLLRHSAEIQLKVLQALADRLAAESL